MAPEARITRRKKTENRSAETMPPSTVASPDQFHSATEAAAAPDSPARASSTRTRWSREGRSASESRMTMAVPTRIISGTMGPSAISGACGTYPPPSSAASAGRGSSTTWMTLADRSAEGSIRSRRGFG